MVRGFDTSQDAHAQYGAPFPVMVWEYDPVHPP